MKTAEEILKENIRGLHNDTGLVRKLVQIMNEYATEVAREALKNASESAKMCLDNSGYTFIINKQSILNESNIPNL